MLLGEVPKIQTDQADDEGELLLDGHASTLTDIREDDESGAKSAMSSKSAAPPQVYIATEALLCHISPVTSILSF